MVRPSVFLISRFLFRKSCTAVVNVPAKYTPLYSTDTRLNFQPFIAFFILILIFSSGSGPGHKVRGESAVDSDSTGITIDGIAKPVNCDISHCKSGILTTTMSNDVIIVFLKCGYPIPPFTDDPCIGDDFSVTDAAGLTFTQRAYYATGEQMGTPYRLLEYYAVADSPLEADNITASPMITYASVPVILAVHGIDTETIFDPDPSLPRTSDCMDWNRSTQSCSVTFGVSGPGLILTNLAITDNPPCELSGGYVRIFGDGYQEVDYRIVDQAEPVSEFTCGGGAAGYIPAAIMVDVLSALPSDSIIDRINSR